MHRGPAGAGSLNLLLQEALTRYREGAPEQRYGGRVFRVGDEVTRLRNNYWDRGRLHGRLRFLGGGTHPREGRAGSARPAEVERRSPAALSA
jgi:ATP-dependent exoDNAse (exonuclease V) alpha subunit